VDRPHNSDGLYATVAGHVKHESAEDEKARGHGAQHVRARGLALKGFKRPAKATGLTRVLTGPDEPLEPLYALRRGDSPSPAVPGADAARDSRQDRGDKFQILSDSVALGFHDSPKVWAFLRIAREARKPRFYSIHEFAPSITLGFQGYLAGTVRPSPAYLSTTARCSGRPSGTRAGP
jgi:hypothetical protein